MDLFFAAREVKIVAATTSDASACDECGAHNRSSQLRLAQIGRVRFVSDSSALSSHRATDDDPESGRAGGGE